MIDITAQVMIKIDKPSGPYQYLAKVILVGDSSVGKSSILCQLNSNLFTNKITPTIGIDFGIMYAQTVALPNDKLKLQIWDCAGQSRFQNIVRAYFRDADIVCYVYDITSQKSFTNLHDWDQDIAECLQDKEYIKCVIGNKVDLEEHRTVSIESGQCFADSIGAIYLETSAKRDINVDLMFLQAADTAYRTLKLKKSIWEEPNNKDSLLNIRKKVTQIKCTSCI